MVSSLKKLIFGTELDMKIMKDKDSDTQLE